MGVRMCKGCVLSVKCMCNGCAMDVQWVCNGRAIHHRVALIREHILVREDILVNWVCYEKLHDRHANAFFLCLTRGTRPITVVNEHFSTCA